MDKNKELNIFYFISKHIKKDSIKNLIKETDNLNTNGEKWNLFELLKVDDFVVYGSGYTNGLTLWSSISGTADKDQFETNIENLFKIINKIIQINNNKEINLYLGIHDTHLVGFLDGGGQNKLETKIENHNLTIKYSEGIYTTITIRKNISKVELFVFQHGGNTKIENVIKKIANNKDVNLDDLKSAFIPDYKKKIVELKHKIIKLWLPLAIDIQGLSEVINSDDKNNQANDYWNKIKGSNDFTTLFDEHNKLINVYNDFLEKYKELKITVKKENEGKLKIFIETIDKNNINVNVLIEQNYLNPDNDFFLPKWLKKLAKTIDQKIEHYQNE